jgi:MFS family permease
LPGGWAAKSKIIAIDVKLVGEVHMAGECRPWAWLFRVLAIVGIAGIVALLTGILRNWHLEKQDAVLTSLFVLAILLGMSFFLALVWTLPPLPGEPPSHQVDQKKEGSFLVMLAGRMLATSGCFVLCFLVLVLAASSVGRFLRE